MEVKESIVDVTITIKVKRKDGEILTSENIKAATDKLTRYAEYSVAKAQENCQSLEFKTDSSRGIAWTDDSEMVLYVSDEVEIEELDLTTAKEANLETT